MVDEIPAIATVIATSSDAMYHVEQECGQKGLIEFAKRFLGPHIKTIPWEDVLIFEGNWLDEFAPTIQEVPLAV